MGTDIKIESVTINKKKLNTNISTTLNQEGNGLILKKPEEELSTHISNQKLSLENTESVASSQYLASLLSKQKSSAVSFGKLGVSGTLDHSAFQNEFTISANRHKESRKSVLDKIHSFKRCPLIPNGMWAHIPAEWLTIISHIMDVIAEAVKQDNIQFINELQDSEKWFYNELSRYFINNIQGDIKWNTVRYSSPMEKGIRDVVSLGKNLLSTHELVAHRHLKNPELLYSSKRISTNPNLNLLKEEKVGSNDSMIQELVDFMDILSFKPSKQNDEEKCTSGCPLVPKTSSVANASYVPDSIKSLLNCKSAVENEKSFIKILQSSLVYGMTDEALDSVEVVKPKARTEDEYDDSQYSEFSEKYCEKTNQKGSAMESDNSEIIEEIVDEVVETLVIFEQIKCQKDVIVDKSVIKDPDSVIKDTDSVSHKHCNLPFPGSPICQSFISSIMPGYLSDKDLEEKLKIHNASVESLLGFKPFPESELTKQRILRRKGSKPKRHRKSIIKEIVAQNRKHLDTEPDYNGAAINSSQTKSALTEDLSFSKRKRHPDSLKSRTTDSSVTRSSQPRLSRMSDDFYSNRSDRQMDKGNIGNSFDATGQDDSLHLNSFNSQLPVIKEKASMNFKGPRNVQFNSEMAVNEKDFTFPGDKVENDQPIVKAIPKERGITETIYRIRKTKTLCKSKKCKDYMNIGTSRKHYREFYNDITFRHQRNIKSKSFGRIKDVKPKIQLYENQLNSVNKSHYLYTHWRSSKLNRSINLLNSIKIRKIHEPINTGKDKRMKKDLLGELLSKTKPNFESPASKANREKITKFPVSPSAYKAPIFDKVIYQPSIDKLKSFRVVYLTQEESELKSWLRNIKERTFHWDEVKKDDSFKLRNSYKLKTTNYENRNKHPCVIRMFDRTDIYDIDDFNYSSCDEVNTLVTDFDSNNVYSEQWVSSGLKNQIKEQKIKFLIEERSGKSLSQFDEIGSDLSENVKLKIHQETVKRNILKYFQAEKMVSIVAEIWVRCYLTSVLNCGTVSQTDKAMRVFTKTENNPETYVSTINVNDSSTLQINETGSVLRSQKSKTKKSKPSAKFYQTQCCKSLMRIIKKDFFFVMYFLQAVCFQGNVIKNDIYREYTSLTEENKSKSYFEEFSKNNLQIRENPNLANSKSSLNLTMEYSSCTLNKEERANQHITTGSSFNDSYAPMTLTNLSDFLKDSFSIGKGRLKSKFNKDKRLNGQCIGERKFKSTLFKNDDKTRYKTNGTLFNRMASNYWKTQNHNEKHIFLIDFLNISNETIAIEIILSVNSITRKIISTLDRENETTCQESICMVIFSDDNDVNESTSKYTTGEQRHLFEIKTCSLPVNDHKYILQNDLSKLDENNTLLSIDVGTTKTFSANITLSNLSESGISKTDETKTLNLISPFSKVKDKYLLHFKTYFESLLANVGMSIETDLQEEENIQQTMSFLKFHNLDSANVVSLDDSKFEIPEIFHLNYLLFFFQNQTDFNWKSILDSFYAEIDFERKTNVENLDGNIKELLEISSDEINNTKLEELKLASVDLGNEIFKNYTIRPLLKNMFFELARSCSLKSFSTRRNVFFYEDDVINQETDKDDDMKNSKLGKLFKNELKYCKIRLDTIIVPVQKNVFKKINPSSLISESGDPVNFQTNQLVMEESHRFMKYIITNVLIDFLKFSFESSDFAILSPINDNLRSVKTISEIIIEILVSRSLVELVGKSVVAYDKFEENTKTNSTDLEMSEIDIKPGSQQIISKYFIEFINDCVNKTTNANNDQFDVLSKLFCCREIIKNVENVMINKLNEKNSDFLQSILTDLSTENIHEIMAFSSLMEDFQKPSSRRPSTKTHVNRQIIASKSQSQARYYHLFSKRFFRTFRIKKPFMNSFLNIGRFNHASQLKLFAKIENYSRKLDLTKYPKEELTENDLTDRAFNFELSQIEPVHLISMLDFNRKRTHKSAMEKKLIRPHKADKGERKRVWNSKSIDMKNSKEKDKKPKHESDFTGNHRDWSDHMIAILKDSNFPRPDPIPFGDFNDQFMEKWNSQSDSRLWKHNEPNKEI